MRRRLLNTAPDEASVGLGARFFFDDAGQDQGLAQAFSARWSDCAVPRPPRAGCPWPGRPGARRWKPKRFSRRGRCREKSGLRGAGLGDPTRPITASGLSPSRSCRKWGEVRTAASTSRMFQPSSRVTLRSACSPRTICLSRLRGWPRFDFIDARFDRGGIAGQPEPGVQRGGIHFDTRSLRWHRATALDELPGVISSVQGCPARWRWQATAALGRSTTSHPPHHPTASQDQRQRAGKTGVSRRAIQRMFAGRTCDGAHKGRPSMIIQRPIHGRSRPRRTLVVRAGWPPCMPFIVFFCRHCPCLIHL